jgi:hypothetical protein
MPQCPECERDFVRRAHRRGVIERLLSVAYVYPFRCQLCGHRFKALRWGTRYSRQPADRREYDRLPANFPLTFRGNQVLGEGAVTDISMAGCAVETQTRLAVGAILQLQLRLPQGGPPVQVEAAIVRSINFKLAGLRFLRFEPHERERLRQFVHHLLSARPR